MTIREPECVALKRRGAKYVAQLLSGKTEQEQLEFWRERTERLLSQQRAKPTFFTFFFWSNNL